VDRCHDFRHRPTAIGIVSRNYPTVNRAALHARGWQRVAPGRGHQALQRPGRRRRPTADPAACLRHGAATLALEAEVDIKLVQELLGHFTSVLTRDTYTSVSPTPGPRGGRAHRSHGCPDGTSRERYRD